MIKKKKKKNTQERTQVSVFDLFNTSQQGHDLGSNKVLCFYIIYHTIQQSGFIHGHSNAICLGGH